ncbi:HAD-IA family hydrolase [Microbacterium resistens]|uniref:HAD-IA family hydrolase n=1 Tax=Microbacterium resistens TaxID=156977 RepID=UPI001E32AEF3|nr:HAD-IA family hydrolase [Microbacterium resistens]
MRKRRHWVGDVDSAQMVEAWLTYVADREHEINAGEAAFGPSHVLDAEALQALTGRGMLPASAVPPLSSASQRLDPWPDTVVGLSRLSADTTVLGLSNASRRVLDGLREHSGMPVSEFLSAEDVGVYKPSAEIYQLALATASPGSAPPYMVAAHAWDLRAAASAGLRTAYVPRLGGDPPAPEDAFDLYADSLEHLHALLIR